MKTPKTSIFIIVILILLVTVSGCNREPRTVANCFYYWKSVFELNPTELASLKSLQIKRFYVKFFDVVWDDGYDGPIPIAAVRFKKSPPTGGIEIVPVVFITVDALERLPAEQSRELAGKIYRRIQSIRERNELGPGAEIQLDCDWNASVKEKYFTILAEMRELAKGRNIRFSATIRLHQVKYPSQTGIPPVDEGMLMFYNFNSPKEPGIGNSILDLKEGKRYTGRLGKYPLPLNIALPLFSWGVVFRDNGFQGLIGNLTHNDLRTNGDFQKISRNKFRALRDCRLKKVAVYQNDIIRLEESRYEECLASARYLAGRVRNSRLKVALFHFDPILIQGAGGGEKVFTLYDSFR